MLTLEEKSNDIIKYNYALDTVIRGNMLSVLFQHPEIEQFLKSPVTWRL